MNNEIQRFIKYIVINGLLTLAYFILFYFFNEIFGHRYLISNFVAYVIATTLAFLGTKIYVFQAKRLYWYEIWEFIIVRFIIVVVSSLGLWFVTSYLGIDEYFSFIFVNGSCFIMSYCLNKKIFLH